MEVNIAVVNIARIFLESSAYIYEEDNVDTLKLLIEEIDTIFTTESRQQIPKIKGYVEQIIPSFTGLEFKSHFRMLPSTFEIILSEIGKKLICSIDGRKMIPPDKQLLLSLWRFATPDSYRSIIQRFDVGKATAIRTVRRVSKALCELSPKYITWSTGNNIQVIVNGFSCTSDFPGIIGAIDGTHINIPAPNKHGEAYVNRKGHHSIHLQAVCDHRRQFTHIYVGNVGSVHDARVFRLSALQEYINDSSKFPNDTHLIGDAAYKLHQHLLVPYSDDGHLTRRQKNYNYCHSSSRMVTERAFALLKGRWRSLLNMLAINDMDFTPYHILACCTLHNICLLNKDELSLQDEVIIVDVQEAEIHERRVDYYDRTIAEAKRNNICANLAIRNV